MKQIQFLVIISAIIISGCGDKDIYLYPSFTESGSAMVHHEGTFSESANIEVREVQDAIRNLDTDGEITDVMIEGIFLDIALNAIPEQPANTASGVISSIYISNWNNTEYILVENVEVNLSGSNQSTNLNQSLNKEGVQQLRNIMKSIADNTVPPGKSHINIRIDGTTIPQATFINAEINVRIKVVVEYKDEVTGL